ncbi:MAG: MaoC family dehydratase N-terminal domain-containing protein [Chloroflexi bacterium]|nr:MaoC family dehydratase N-terminal domain-containing protein [Chloroflexota bacterium]
MATLEEAVAEGQRHVGTTGAATSRVIEAGAIRRFVDALGDSNPLYTDAEYARQTRWGGIIAPPTFLCTIQAPLSLPDLGFGRVNLNGGSSYEWHRPVRPGDVITAQATLVEVRGVQSSTGPLLILVREIRYTDQDGRLVAEGRSTGLRR